MFDFKSISISALLLLSSFFASAQWQPCEGIIGANISDVILHDSIIFIGGVNGIFMRDVSDSVWEPSLTPFPGQTVRSIGSALFCHGPMARPYKSLDNGSSWQSVCDDWYVMGLDVCDSCVFMLDYHTLMRSCDDGQTWDPIYPSSLTPVTISIYAQPGVIFCTLDDVDSIFQSTDVGNNWSGLPITGLAGTIHDIFLREGTLWLGASTGAYHFNDQTNEWMLASDSIPEGTVVNSFFEDESGLACCTSAGYFRFNDQDSSWYDINSGLESKSLYAACNTGSSIIIASGSGPFVRQYDSLNWESNYNALYQRDVYQIFKAGNRIYALSPGRIYYSDDISEGFQILETQGFCSSGKFVITDTAWYAASSCGFLISIDSGLTWNAYTTGMEGIAVQDVAVSDSFYYARVYGGLFRTRNDTINWERTPNSIGTANVWGVSTVNNVVFARVYGQTGLYRSVDNGTTFNPVPQGGAYAPDLFVRDSMIFIIKDGFGLLYSTDSGDSWQTWVSGFTNTMLTCMDLSASTDTTLVGGGDLTPGALVDYILKLCTPGNPSGEDIHEGLPLSTYPFLRAVFFDNGRIFAAPNRNGLWYRNDNIVGINDNELHLTGPSKQLIEIFPNPACEQMTILLGNKVRNGTITILDPQGRTWSKLSLPADVQSIEVNVAALSQGVYYLVLARDGYIIATRKFIKVSR